MKKKIIRNMLAVMTAGIMLCACGEADSEAPAEETVEEQTEETAEAKTEEKTEETATDTADADYALFDVSKLPGAYDISDDELVYVSIEVEGYGTVTAALDSTIAPVSTENFVNLAERGFYDGLTFHRIMEGFMIQGGDPEGNGTGGSGNNIKGEFSINGVENPITHVRGALSMARAYDPDSASSQFFIVQADSEFLDGQYAGFGYVTDGMEVVDAICADAVPVDDNGSIAPSAQPVIKSIKVLSR